MVVGQLQAFANDGENGATCMLYGIGPGPNAGAIMLAQVWWTARVSSRLRLCRCRSVAAKE